MSACTDTFLETMDQLRLHLNRTLYLGLYETENHFAMYPPGSFYRRHIDRFRDDDRRVVSSILYLNEQWLPQHGGALRLLLKDGPTDVDPVANRLVLFMSDQVEHEVLVTHAQRLSLTGWFRRQ